MRQSIDIKKHQLEDLHSISLEINKILHRIKQQEQFDMDYIDSKLSKGLVEEHDY